ncbi:MAG: ribokinase [Candidatus Atribacteria bacterium]|nr:ribokinase [Candidatus Atribacteria bacterium]
MAIEYSEKEREGIIVIGGANIDVKGKPKNFLQWMTSNPGSIQVSHGGVGRNIAHYLGLLNIPVTFLSAVGDDEAGREILEKLRHAQVQTGEIIQSKKDPTGKYIAVLNEKGDMEVGISDTEIMKRVTPRYLIAKAGIIRKNRMVIIDANLTTRALNHIASFCSSENIPILVDPVSVEKSRKLLGILPKIDFLTPNMGELSSLSGTIIKEIGDSKRAIERLMKKGVNHIILTGGTQGAYLYSKEVPEGKFIRTRRRKMVDSTGAGDALLAGFAYGLYHNYELSQAVQAGLIMSALTVTSSQTVYSKLNEMMLKKEFSRTFSRSL